VFGIKASNGCQYLHASTEPGLTILALGAELSRLLPEAKDQVTAKAWSVAHLELTSTEAVLLKDAPVVSLSELGFWIEPVRVVQEADQVLKNGESVAGSRTHNYLLKLAAHGGGWTKTEQRSTNGQLAPVSDDQELPTSLPPTEPMHIIPASDEQLLRELIRLTLPKSLHNRHLVKKSMCWCADTASSDFLIDFVPGYEGLLVAGADSGHGFKFLPVFGKRVADVVNCGQQREARWRWKASGNRSDVGGTVAWRSGSVRDLNGEVLN